MKTPLSLLVLLLAFSPSLSAQTTNIPASPANTSNTSKDISSKAPTPGTVNLVKQGGQYLVTGETYTAVVPDNGLLSQINFTHKAGWITSGFLSKPLTVQVGREINPAFTCPDITQPSPNVLLCKGEKLQISYEFTAKEILCQATSLSTNDTRILFDLNPKIEGIYTEDNHGEKKLVRGNILTTYGTQVLKAPYAESLLRLTGFVTLYDPGMIQWGINPKPQSLAFHIEPATPEEVALFAFPPLWKDPLTIMAPMDWQVFQRRTRSEGTIALRGRCALPCDRLEYSLSGPSVNGAWQQDWRQLPLNPATHAFSASVPVPAGGWYRCEFRALKGGQNVASKVIDHVGVGEVFVVAGQSNSTNNAKEKLKPESGLVSTFSGDSWRPAEDPQPGVSDHSFRGSFLPPLGDALAAHFKVPIGFASTGHGGTSLVQWYPGGELFDWTERRILQLGPEGFRAVIWHQGESGGGDSPAEYHDRLKAVIEESNRLAGWSFPWMVALATSSGTPREGQKMAWADGTAVEGPDTDLLAQPTNRVENKEDGGKGAHYTHIGLIHHAGMWSDKLIPWIESQLAP
jgi:hypothetical protein